MNVKLHNGINLRLDFENKKKCVDLTLKMLYLLINMKVIKKI